jgi:hypothetical protein
MQIQTDYSNYTYLASGSYERAASSSARSPINKTSGTDSLEYRSFQKEVTALLSNPDLSSLERTKIMSLQTRGQSAAVQDSMGELQVLFNEIKRFNPEIAAEGPSTPGTASPGAASTTPDEGLVTYQDQSGDANVSFKSPVAINEYQAPIAVRAHEGEHVALAQARAMINDQNVTTYVSYHTGYDSNGRLILTGGTTTTIVHPEASISPIPIGSSVNIIV